MAYREKLSWILLLSTVIAYGAYFLWLGARWPSLGIHAPVSAYFGPLVAVVTLQTVLAIGGTILVAILAPRDVAAGLDERDRSIAGRALVRAYPVLISGLLGALTAVLFAAPPFWLVNEMLATIVFAELVRYGGEALAYRAAA